MHSELDRTLAGYVVSDAKLVAISNDSSATFEARDIAKELLARRKASTQSTGGSEAVGVKRPHKWVKSTLGHGEQMCEYCKGTNRELAVLGELDHCTAAPPEGIAARDAVIEEAVGQIDNLRESLMEGLMTDAGLTKADRRAMNHQIEALEVAADDIRALRSPVSSKDVTKS